MATHKGVVAYVSDYLGTIEAKDGYEYQFSQTDVIGGAELHVGDLVSFSLDGEAAVKVRFLKADFNDIITFEEIE